MTSCLKSSKVLHMPPQCTVTVSAFPIAEFPHDGNAQQEKRPFC